MVVLLEDDASCAVLHGANMAIVIAYTDVSTRRER